MNQTCGMDDLARILFSHSSMSIPSVYKNGSAWRLIN
jgi:hypothetical protein